MNFPFREYVKFELLFVEKLLARKKVLQIADSNVVEEKNKEDESETEEDAKSKKDSQFDAVDDKILNCDLVNLVVKVRFWLVNFKMLDHIKPDIT